MTVSVSIGDADFVANTGADNDYFDNGEDDFGEVQEDEMGGN